MRIATLTLVFSGCAAVHSYDAPRDINPARTLSYSGSVGTTIVDRDRNGDEKVDGWRQEKVLVPDAKVNIRIRTNEWMSIALDPLPPGIGGGVVFRHVIETEGSPTVTLAPVINYLVYPNQGVWSAEVPLALSRKLGDHWVMYAGPKYVYQSKPLEREKTAPGKYILYNVPNRDPNHEFNFLGGFVGIGFGFLHVQVSPEILFYQSLDDGERVFQIGSQIRFSL